MKQKLHFYKTNLDIIINDIISYLNLELKFLTDIIQLEKNEIYHVSKEFNLPENLKTKNKNLEKILRDTLIQLNSEKIIFISKILQNNTFLVFGLEKNSFREFDIKSKDIDSFLSFLIKTLISYISVSSKNFVEFDKEEFIRKCAKKYIQSILNQIGVKLKIEEIFTILSVISKERYEKQPLDGYILFSDDLSSIDVAFSFDKVISFSKVNYRIIRKILELSRKSGLVVLANDIGIFGIGKLLPSFKNGSIIRFHSEGFWEFCIYNSSKKSNKNIEKVTIEVSGIEFLPLIRVKNGLPELPRLKLDKEKIKEAIRYIYSDVKKNFLKKLYKILEAITTFEHGLIMIISDPETTKLESKRLSTQFFSIYPFNLFKDEKHLDIDLLNSITSIDGATFIDTEGYCHSFGIILDGDSISTENPSRGARYNSSLRYIATRNEKAIAVVVSDDGMIDIIHKGIIERYKLETISEFFLNEPNIVS